ncbi:hypothetical protein WJX74_008449 [Apatococcus lobatus]|uniref:Uncharacterized protein n=1 Tax=Apatococcus lobatus TaxID=904363 RepID=A0AAW1S7J6_9CHLO
MLCTSSRLHNTATRWIVSAKPRPWSSQMLDLPRDSEGLAFLAASNPHDLLLIHGLLPASITAAALGDQQAASYLRFAAQHFAAFQSPCRDEIKDIAGAAAALATKQGSDDELEGLLQKGQEKMDILSTRKEYSAGLLYETTRKGMLAELKWLRALCQHDAGAESRLMDIAADEGHLDILQHLRSGPNPAPWGDSCCDHAVPHTECLKWLIDSGCPCHEGTLPGLAVRGDLDTLQWIHAHPQAVVPASFWNATVTAGAAESGSLPLLQWLPAPPLSCPWDSSCKTAAAMKGNLSMLQWLRGQDPPCPWNLNAARVATSRGDMPLLQWLRAQGCPWDALCCFGAARRGDIAMLQWARAQEPPCPWDERSIRAAAGKPSIECLQWLRAQDPPCPWDEVACVMAASRDLRVLKWLREQDPPCPWDADTSETAAMQGNLPMLQWLHEQGCDINGRAYLAAVFRDWRGPHKPVLQWLQGVGVPAPAKAPAADFKDVHILLWWAGKGFCCCPSTTRSSTGPGGATVPSMGSCAGSGVPSQTPPVALTLPSTALHPAMLARTCLSRGSTMNTVATSVSVPYNAAPNVGLWQRRDEQEADYSQIINGDSHQARHDRTGRRGLQHVHGSTVPLSGRFIASHLPACPASDEGGSHPSRLPPLLISHITRMGKGIDDCCPWACVLGVEAVCLVSISSSVPKDFHAGEPPDPAGGASPRQLTMADTAASW